VPVLPIVAEFFGGPHDGEVLEVTTPVVEFPVWQDQAVLSPMRQAVYRAMPGGPSRLNGRYCFYFEGIR